VSKPSRSSDAAIWFMTLGMGVALSGVTVLLGVLGAFLVKDGWMSHFTPWLIVGLLLTVLGAGCYWVTRERDRGRRNGRPFLRGAVGEAQR
jgi:hypothetical protein